MKIPIHITVNTEKAQETFKAYSKTLESFTYMVAQFESLLQTTQTSTQVLNDIQAHLEEISYLCKKAKED